MPLSASVLIGLADNPGIGAGDTTHQEGGNVQLLPCCEVVPNDDSDLDVEHGPRLLYGRTSLPAVPPKKGPPEGGSPQY